MSHPALPEILESCAAALVGLGMHEFCGHEHLVSVGETAHAGEICRVVMGVDIIEIGPGVYNVTFLRVEIIEETVEVGVPSAFVSVVPDDDAGMVHIALHHLLDKDGTHFVVIASVPAREFVKVEYSKGVAHVKEMHIGGIVRADRIHVHLLDEQGVLQVDLVIERADNTVNLCEMKYNVAEYAITAEYEHELARKMQALQSTLGKRKTVRLTMITNNGLKHNAHSYMEVNEVQATAFL